MNYAQLSVIIQKLLMRSMLLPLFFSCYIFKMISTLPLHNPSRMKRRYGVTSFIVMHFADRLIVIRQPGHPSVVKVTRKASRIDGCVRLVHEDRFIAVDEHVQSLHVLQMERRILELSLCYRSHLVCTDDEYRRLHNNNSHESYFFPSNRKVTNMDIGYTFYWHA